MSAEQVNVEIINKEEKFRNLYFILSLILFIVSIILIIFFLVVTIGVISPDVGHDWALLSFNDWLLSLSGIFAAILILELIFYLHFRSIHNNRIELEKPKPEFINGKKVYVLTLPKNQEGGVYAKTYIEIDNHTLLRLRTMMIPPSDMS